MRTAKDWFEEELSGEPLTQDSVIECIKMVQEEVIRKTVEACAENAQIRFWDGHFQKAKLLKHFQIGANNLTISTESIRSVADKLIKEL
jgi:hypothetical protein